MEEIEPIETYESLLKRKESSELLPCSECAIFNMMQPCEACSNNPKNHQKRMYGNIRDY